MSSPIRIGPPSASSSNRVPIFRLRLRNGASIGPTTLKRVWSTAAGSSDVGVSRETRRFGSARIPHVYVMSGPPHIGDLKSIETRLQTLLQETFAMAHIELTRLI